MQLTVPDDTFAAPVDIRGADAVPCGMLDAPRSLVLTLAMMLAGCAHGSPTVAPTPPASPSSAKPFAMRMYVFVVLRRGPAWTAESTPESARLFEGHMANIKAMVKAGQLVLAGPFETPAEERDGLAGIFIFDATKFADVEPLLARDPAIAGGRLVAQMTLWYGPAGLTYDGAERPG